MNARALSIEIKFTFVLVQGKLFLAALKSSHSIKLISVRFNPPTHLFERIGKQTGMPVQQNKFNRRYSYF